MRRLFYLRIQGLSKAVGASVFGLIPISRYALTMRIGVAPGKVRLDIDHPVRIYRAQFGNSAVTPSGQQRAVADRASIAVLPFQNMSQDPEQEYFADGMVEDIITGLSRIKSLFVIARNSSFAYKGRTVDVKQIGRELGVRYVLEGSVRKAGNRVRITAQLIEAETNRHIWAERYDRALDDIFALQDDITMSTVASIAEPAPGGDRARQAQTARQSRRL